MNTTICTTSEFAPNRDQVRLIKSPDLATLLSRAVDVLHTWQQRSVDRKRLQTMDQHQLSDIGIDHFQAQRESAKPFWRS